MEIQKITDQEIFKRCVPIVIYLKLYRSKTIQLRVEKPTESNIDSKWVWVYNVVSMNRNTFKKLGRRKAGTWGRTHGPKGGHFSTKRAANKAVRRVANGHDE